MKKGTTPRALIGTALLIAFGLLLMMAGITSSPWHLDGGIVGGLLSFKPDAKNALSIYGLYLSVALSALLTLVGLVGIAVGLVTAVLGLSRRRSKARSIGWLLVGALMVALVAIAFSTFWSTSERSPAGRRAAAVKARAALAELGFQVAPGHAPGKVIVEAYPWVTDAGLKELKEANEELKCLEELHLEYTQITDAGLKELKKFTSLESLQLDVTRVTDAGLKELKEFESLRTLNLNRTRVTDAGLKELKELQSLQFLGLGGTQVTDAGLKELKELQRLKFLHLNGTQVTDAGLKELKELQSLQFLGLDGTQVTDSGVQELKALRPGLQITAKVR
jgi:hypothetical protein